MVLFDTNILVYVHNHASPYHRTAYSLEAEVLKRSLSAAISIQNLLEFYSTATNPKLLTMPLTAQQAKQVIHDYLNSAFQLIYPREDDLYTTLELASKRDVKGRKVFDVHLVATMLSNGISTIYTGNDKDFKMFKEIKVVNPFI